MLSGRRDWNFSVLQNLAGGLRADDDEIIQRSITRIDDSQQLMLEGIADLALGWGLLRTNNY